ncbi:MAG TPA: hypothetical protein VJA27_00565 [Patescibacteria group bacterium]|nr:hypothetical protein [Patescibacteria group bacterium]
MFIIILQRLFLEALFDLVYFPVWWYTGGVKHAARWCFGLFQSGNRTLAPGLWLKNMFVPMFGQFDWQGRIISVFMRLVNVIGRTIALVFWLGICFVLFLLWIVFPVGVMVGLVYSAAKLGG